MQPIFSTDVGGRGLFTTTEATELDTSAPISVATVCQKHGLKRAIVVDSRPDSIISLFDSLSKIGADLLFGYKITVCDDATLKDEGGTKSESKIIVFLNNEAAWVNFCKIWTWAEKNGFYYIPRIDWKHLKELWCEGLGLAIPFYDSFLYQNLFKYGAQCVPDFGFLRNFNQKPAFFLEDHKLPVDGILGNKVKNYCQNNDFLVDKTHTSYYYSKDMIDAYCTFRCIKARGATVEKPNMDGFGSDGFDFLTAINNE